MELYGYSPVLDMLDAEDEAHDVYACDCADCKESIAEEMAERNYEARRGN